MVNTRIFARVARRPQQFKLHLEWCVSEKAYKLGFSDYLGRHNVEQCDFKRTYILFERPFFGNAKYVLPHQNIVGRQI